MSSRTRLEERLLETPPEVRWMEQRPWAKTLLAILVLGTILISLYFGTSRTPGGAYFFVGFVGSSALAWAVGELIQQRRKLNSLERRLRRLEQEEAGGA